MASRIKVKIGNIAIGGGEAVAIQSMTNTPTTDCAATLAQIKNLETAGCEIVRLSVPDMDSAEALVEIRKKCSIPMVADIHFDHRLALKAIENGIDKLRINPGNIGSVKKVKEVVSACKDKGIPIRIGVNGGSLERDLAKLYEEYPAKALAESALRHVTILENLDFHNTVVSIKSSSSSVTVEANRILASKIPYPIHLGVTEAGLGISAQVKSSVALGALLLDGIGDTIRISVTGNPVSEIAVAKEILSACELRRFGVNIISCPTCARCKVDLESIAKEVQTATANINKPLTIAVMGCQVNGPGEAREADIAICGAPEDALLFVDGKLKSRHSYGEIRSALLFEIQNYLD